MSSELAALQKEYGEWRLQRSPEYATTIGVYKHNDQVENYAYSGFVEEYVCQKEYEAYIRLYIE